MTIHVEVIIPFRDRGIDPRRAANLEVVQAWWYAHGYEPLIVDDGLEGDAQFNRHRAYNRAVAKYPEAEVYVFTEADMLIHPDQINRAVIQAHYHMGLVVPFTQYRYLSDRSSSNIRDGYHDLSAEALSGWWGLPTTASSSIFQWSPESTMNNGRSIGAVNVVSAETLRTTGGFTEATSGNWYDDRIIEEGFAFLTGQDTRYVDGPAVHLYHLPGHSGEHLSAADKKATLHNRELLHEVRSLIRRRAYLPIREIMEARR